jgi:hypothetical protein
MAGDPGVPDYRVAVGFGVPEGCHPWTKLLAPLCRRAHSWPPMWIFMEH